MSKVRETWQRAGGKKASELTFRRFLVALAIGYKRIRKRPRGSPSPQLYESKVKELRELESKADSGKTDLFYADESHVYTESYIPYGWQFLGEDFHGPSQKTARLNIFDMTTRNNRYESFTSSEGINSANIAETLWRVLKGKWIRPRNYESDSLFYAVNKALAAVGTSLFIKHFHFAL